MPTEEEELAILEELNATFALHVPSGYEIASATIADALKGLGSNPKWIKKNFSRLVEEVQIEAYNRYLLAERIGWKEAFSAVFGPMFASCSKHELVAGIVGDHFYALDRFFLSRTQSRRARAGTALETLLHAFFKKLNYPFTPQPKIDGNPDFVFPSIDHYLDNAPDTIIFTAKRTLRERWRQIGTEGAKGLGFFLATIDEKVSIGDVRAMKAHRISMVVPKRIKNEVPIYVDSPNVISFEDFFIDHLDPAMAKWKRNGII